MAFSPSPKYKLYADQVAHELWIHGNVEAAARATEGKVCSKTIRRWMDYSDFVHKIEQKGAEVEKKCFDAIFRDASWQSKAWILERRCGEKYIPPKSRTELTGKDGGPVEIIDDARKLLLSRINSLAPVKSESEPD